MDDTRTIRLIAKLLPDGSAAEGAEKIADTGEPLETVMELLKDWEKLRRTRRWILENSGMDLAVSPPVFHALLKISRINFIESATRNLDVEVVSLKETRGPTDPVAVGHLNTALRELYRSLEAIREAMLKDFPDPLLKNNIDIAHLDRIDGFLVETLGAQKNQLKALFGAGRLGKIEKEFQDLFPDCPRAHPLRETAKQVAKEMDLYRAMQKGNEKWSALNLDLFPIVRRDGLSQLLQNIQEMGTLLWNLVYLNPAVERSARLAGIDLADIATLFPPK